MLTPVGADTRVPCLSEKDTFVVRATFIADCLRTREALRPDVEWTCHKRKVSTLPNLFVKKYENTFICTTGSESIDMETGIMTLTVRQTHSTLDTVDNGTQHKGFTDLPTSP